jgi:hypothetical protein
MENKTPSPYQPPVEGVDLNSIAIENSQADVNSSTLDLNRQRYLNELIATSEVLKEIKSKTITFQQPIISAGDTGVIYPNTITLIQGPAGAHKSRLAQGLCSLVIGKNDSSFLGYNFVHKKEITLCYLDTERNIKDQFPYALQQVQWKAGYRHGEHPANFHYSSFIKVPRMARLQALEDYVQHLRENTNGHLFVVLDVISDLIADFNRVDESMKCIDWMNKMINEYDISFLAIIHENPGGEKARGHVGTELVNKVTTAIQIAPERDLEEEGIYRIAYKKNRNTHKLGFFNVRYSEQTKGLAIVQNDEMNNLRSDIAEKAPIPEVLPFLLEILPEDGIAGKDLISAMMAKFNTSDKTIMQRLSGLIESKRPIPGKGEKVLLLEKYRKGQSMWYKLSSE